MSIDFEGADKKKVKVNKTKQEMGREIERDFRTLTWIHQFDRHVLQTADLLLLWSVDHHGGGAEDAEHTAQLTVQVQPLGQEVRGQHRAETTNNNNTPFSVLPPWDRLPVHHRLQRLIGMESTFFHTKGHQRHQQRTNLPLYFWFLEFLSTTSTTIVFQPQLLCSVSNFECAL